MRPDGKFLKKFWVTETPSGLVNGSNVTYTITQTPFDANDAVEVFLDGIRRTRVTEWSISGTTITMVAAPVLGQELLVEYVMLRGEN